jgi:hypothetical protein
LLAHHLAILLDSKSLGPCGGIIPTKYGSLTPTRAIEAKGKTTASRLSHHKKASTREPNQSMRSIMKNYYKG